MNDTNHTHHTLLDKDLKIYLLSNYTWVGLYLLAWGKVVNVYDQ